MTRLVDSRWREELRDAVVLGEAELRVVCPFLKLKSVQRLLEKPWKSIQVITRFNLDDFARGVSDVTALRALMNAGAQVRGVKRLHAKVFVFGTRRAIVTSANLTEAALSLNREFGLVSDEPTVVNAALSYFTDLWRQAGPDLATDTLTAWGAIVSQRQTEARSDMPSLGDFGVDLGTASDRATPIFVATEYPQAFVKFLGRSSDRVPLSHRTLDEVKIAGCHWALTYPTAKRPRGVEDGALMFVARLTHSPNDIRIFGRALGIAYRDGRDDASPEEIQDRPWKADWSRYIRVHHAEFVAGTMANGISLNQLMDALGSDSFLSTQRNALGRRNVNPRAAYSQQPAVQLTIEGTEWLAARLEEAFLRHGTIALSTVAGLDWPIQSPQAAS